MKLKAWKPLGRYCFDTDSSYRTVSRDSEAYIPRFRSFMQQPSIRMVVTNQYGGQSMLYDVYLEDSEYGIKTYYGRNLKSLEQGKFIADLKLIELGYEIEEPFFLKDKDV